MDQSTSSGVAFKNNLTNEEEREKAAKLESINNAIKAIKNGENDKTVVNIVKPILKKQHKVKAFILDYSKEEKIQKLERHKRDLD